jgi:drug/metabolite transporter superfamily protein YnfA
MPARTFVSLLLIVIAAAGATIFAASQIGIPFAALGLVAVVASLALRVWIDRR